MTPNMFHKIFVVSTLFVTFLSDTLARERKLCSGMIREDATEISYSIKSKGWKSDPATWSFIFEYETPASNYRDWKIMLEFPKRVLKLNAYDAKTEGPYMAGLLWFLTPKQYNFQVTNDVIGGSATATTYGRKPLDAVATIIYNGAYPSRESLLLLEDDCSVLLRIGRTATTPSPPIQGCDLPDHATDISIQFDPHTWTDHRGLGFMVRYTSTRSVNFENWKLKLVFSENVTELEPHQTTAEGPYNSTDGSVWLLTPKEYNVVINGYVLEGSAVAYANSSALPAARAIVFNNGVEPDTSFVQIVGCGPTVPPINEVTTEDVGSGFVEPTSETATPGWVPTTNVTGILPLIAEQTVLDFIASPAVTADEPYDYNEVLHKSILFYEAQRSGELPRKHRVPWRGDSGLLDGCVNGFCYADLTGGYYDAGDHVKFGFPMAWTTTVLAWGMLEFKKGYKEAGETRASMNMLRWSVDYLMKAHVSPYELYFQVGDPSIDHSNWGHPETMTMERPVYKIDRDHPGSEVAAETAAALAAASIVLAKQTNYSAEILQHAIELYRFADLYRGHYHESVPESRVQDYYKSWSGYNDELTWAAMWLYKATDDPKYLADAITCSKYLGDSEFSWDQKGPGALLLLSEAEPTEYRPKLYAALDKIMNSYKTPGGLVHIQPWGSNRHAANYAFIALMTANMVGLQNAKGQTYYEFGKDQIEKLLGSGDNNRSYVVGFGQNPPQRPHHRSSSCRQWSEVPASRICNFDDLNANAPNPQILYGALVGGPDRNGNYVDDRTDYVQNEVAIDYNAGFQSAVAGLRYFQTLS